MSSRKLTQEEKEQRARKRDEADARMKANAPHWSMMIDTEPDESRIRYVTVSSDCGTGWMAITVTMPNADDTTYQIRLSRAMTLEDWAELADAALRRVKWMTGQLKELNLDETVLAAMGRVPNENKP